MNDKRTLAQNRSIHKFCSMLSEALNDAGLDMKKTLKPHVEIPWTPANVKEHIWRPIQEAMLEKESTTELDTKQVNEVYEVINRHMAQNHGVSVEFPHEER